MGLFVKLAKPTAPMKKEAASAGVLDTPFGKFARLPERDVALITRAEPLAPAPFPGLHELTSPDAALGLWGGGFPVNGPANARNLRPRLQNLSTGPP